MWFCNIHYFEAQIVEGDGSQSKHLKLAHDLCPDPLATSWGRLLEWGHSYHSHQTVDCDSRPLRFLLHWSRCAWMTVLRPSWERGFLLKRNDNNNNKNNNNKKNRENKREEEEEDRLTKAKSRTTTTTIINITQCILHASLLVNSYVGQISLANKNLYLA